MSSQTNNVVLTLLFEDNSKRNITFEGVASGDILPIKFKIKAINANENDQYENFYKTFVSEAGSAITKIESCKVLEIEEEVIYSG